MPRQTRQGHICFSALPMKRSWQKNTASFSAAKTARQWNISKNGFPSLLHPNLSRESLMKGIFSSHGQMWLITNNTQIIFRQGNCALLFPCHLLLHRRSESLFLTFQRLYHIYALVFSCNHEADKQRHSHGKYNRENICNCFHGALPSENTEKPLLLILLRCN